MYYPTLSPCQPSNAGLPAHPGLMRCTSCQCWRGSPKRRLALHSFIVLLLHTAGRACGRNNSGCEGRVVGK